MKVVQLLQKAWPEFIVLSSSMAYLMIRIVANINKINGLNVLTYLRFHHS